MRPRAHVADRNPVSSVLADFQAHLQPGPCVHGHLKIKYLLTETPPRKHIEKKVTGNSDQTSGP